MKNDDRITYKLKNKPKKKKENDSNNSRDSLEMELKSYKANEKIKRKKTAAGEEIKFFFNDAITDNKLSKFSISPKPTIKINPRSTFNFSKEQSQLNFKDILLNYVKSPKCKNKKKDDNRIERKSTIIYGNPETVLTLNGDDSSENSQRSKNDNDKRFDLKSNSDSESKSGKINLEDIYSNVESSSNNDSIKDKNEQNINNKKKIDNSKESSYKSYNTSKFDESIKMLPNLNNNSKYNSIHNSNHNSNNNSNHNSNNNSKNSDKNNEEENENNEYNKNEIKEITEIESEKEVVNNELNQNIPNEIIKDKSSKNNNKKSNKDSCFNSKQSQNLKTSNGNTFTTTTNTQHTHNTQNTHNTHNTHSSFQSIKINNKKIKYNYLCWNNLPLEKKILIKNRNNSVKRINTNEIIKIKENFIKDEKTSIMLFKLKNLNISLDIEKTYSYFFKNLTKFQNQKNHYKNKSNNNLKNYSNKSIIDYTDNNFYYPDEYYINKNNNLHNKSHVSNLFDKLRQFKNS